MGDVSECSIRVRMMCRGTGKVFAAVEAVGLPDDVRLTVRCELQDGTQVPAKLLLREDRSYVLVVAVLKLTQTVVFSGLWPDGTVRVLAKRTVHPRVARMSSHVHTGLGDRRIEDIRNYDSSRSFADYDVDLARVLTGRDETDYVQCVARCTHDDLEVLHEELEVRVISRKGKDVALGECLIGRDAIMQEPDNATCFTRTVQFTFKISQDLSEFIIWVRPKHAREGSPCGFYAVESFYMRDKRNLWKFLMEPAIENEYYSEIYERDWAPAPLDMSLQRRADLSVRPLFSIIVPLSSCNIINLGNLIKSVLSQSYDTFELVLVNAAPRNATLARFLDAWTKKDGRIRVVTLEEDLGSAENTNEGIKASRGDMLCFMGQDDIITPDALYCYASALEDYPDTDLFYSDEDTLGKNDKHSRPVFKPDWNPDLLLGKNYVGHFLAVRRSAVDFENLPTSVHDGAQDYALTLQVSERARNVYHSRRVLYHVRKRVKRASGKADETTSEFKAGLRAVQDHLDRCKANAKAVPSTRLEGCYEVEYALTDTPLVSILIPNKDSFEVLDRCLKSIDEKTDYENYEVIVIENNSTDPHTFEYYKLAQEIYKNVRVVYFEGTGFNFARINNFGATEAKGEYLVLLNNDTEVISTNWLSRMVAVGSREGTGIVGVKLLYFDKTVQHAGVMSYGAGPDHAQRFLRYDAPRESIQLMQDFTAVTAACLLVPRKVFDEVDGLCEKFEVDYNDVDFCWKVYGAGYRVVCDPSVMLYHHESISRGPNTSKKSAARFQRELGLLHLRWPGHFSGPDPMSNPSLDQGSLYGRLR